MFPEDIGIIRKRTWQVPFRISTYEIEDGRKFVLSGGEKRKAAALARTDLTRGSMEPNGLTATHANNARTIS